MAQAIPGYVDRMMVNPPLSVSGAEILDASGYPVRLAGVNWSGAHQNGLVPAGLDKLHRSEIISRIARARPQSRPAHVRARHVSARSMHAEDGPGAGPVAAGRLQPGTCRACPRWQVYQQIAADLVQAGIAVIPNRHLLFQGQCCSDTDANGLWNNSNWPASAFAATWTLIATQFASESLVIGYDLKNEPRPATFGGATWNPSWGDGSTDTDFRLMYSDTASRIRAASGGNPKLFFCEGLSYASDLTKAGTGADHRRGHRLLAARLQLVPPAGHVPVRLQRGDGCPRRLPHNRGHGPGVDRGIRHRHRRARRDDLRVDATVPVLGQHPGCALVLVGSCPPKRC